MALPSPREVVPPGRVWRIRPFCPGNWTGKCTIWGFRAMAWECQVWLPAFAACPGWGALVVDIQPNAGPQGLLETNLPAFLDAVRGCAPQLPVLVLSASWQTKCGWNSTEAEQFAREERFQQQEVERRKSRGDSFIWFASARDMLETVAKETTVDGVHLTDLGFWLLAQKLRPLLCRMLEQGQTNE